MRIRLVKTLQGGERLAGPVITEEKETLISQGTVLKTEYLDLISFLGIETVCIEDPYEEEEEPHRIISKSKREVYIEKIKKILENHIYHGKNSLQKIEQVAREITEDVLQVDENIVIDLEERNGNLYDHTMEVTILALMVGRKLKVREEDLYRIALGALLHDLGLRYVTVSYVNCDMNVLSSAEIFEYRKHPILAYSALEQEDWLDSSVKKMILSHHERRDGSGFPLRQKTRDVECGILQACDALDCFISGMECKRIGIQEALEYLVEAADILFERRIIKVIEHLVARYPAGTKVRLNTGEVGVVLSQTGNSIRPVIGVLNKEGELTEVRYRLDKNKKVSILQVENE